jgi:dipeptidyl aminopeptidase/acylaminoacyl peptidase
VAPPRDETLEIAGAAGLTIQTTLKTPAGNAPFPGVMLLHMLGSNRAVWDEVGLMDQLLRSGYAVIAVDMRGHGETGGDPDWVLAETDLQLVWEAFTALPEVDGARTAVVGASIGSNMSLITGANIPAVQTVVMLSPGLDYRGVMPGERLGDWGERPLFIAASEEDAYSADSSRTLVEEADGEAVLQMYQGAGHGTNMFGPQPDLIALILDWLNEHL